MFIMTKSRIKNTDYFLPWVFAHQTVDVDTEITLGSFSFIFYIKAYPKFFINTQKHCVSPKNFKMDF
jgi:hypothetical protein